MLLELKKWDELGILAAPWVFHWLPYVSMMLSSSPQQYKYVQNFLCWPRYLPPHKIIKLAGQCCVELKIVKTPLIPGSWVHGWQFSHANCFNIWEENTKHGNSVTQLRAARRQKGKHGFHKDGYSDTVRYSSICSQLEITPTWLFPLLAPSPCQWYVMLCHCPLIHGCSVKKNKVQGEKLNLSERIDFFTNGVQGKTGLKINFNSSYPL